MVGRRLHTQAAVRVRLAVAAVCLIAAVGTAYGAGDTQQTTAPATAAPTAGTPVGTAADDGSGRRPAPRPDDNRSLLNYPFLFDVASVRCRRVHSVASRGVLLARAHAARAMRRPRSQAPIEVPLPVRVALLGFQGEGAHGVRLQASVRRSLRRAATRWTPAALTTAARPLAPVSTAPREVAGPHAAQAYTRRRARVGPGAHGVVVAAAGGRVQHPVRGRAHRRHAAGTVRAGAPVCPEGRV